MMSIREKKVKDSVFLLLLFSVLIIFGLANHILAEETVSTEVDSNSQAITKAMNVATQIEGVKTNSLPRGIEVQVTADGAIKEFKAFTIGNPARIIYDFFGLKSLSESEQVIDIDSGWASKVRYYSYPDRVRLVIETHQRFLSDFSAESQDDGIVIKVGEKSAPAKAASNQDSMQAVKKGANWIQRIDFSSENAGKSMLVIGTTKPIEYKIKKASANQILLELYDTKVPSYRRRPLITTRFNSAINRIIPFQKPGKKDITVISIELRETVPYQIEKTGNLMMVHFEASSVPPKTLAEANLPPWKQAMNQAAIASEGEGISFDGMDKSKVISQASSIMDESTKVYTGEKIALDFYETDIKNVFRILREISGKNFAIDKDVTGKVTLTLDRPVPWDQILDLVLKMNQLGMTLDNDIIRIATIETLKGEEAKRREILAEAQALKQQKIALEPLLTEYISVNYADAEKEMLPHLTKLTTPERGNMTVDQRTNTIIMTDTAKKIKKARSIVAQLDKVTPQVVIEARVVEANTSFSREIGTQWGAAAGVQSPDLVSVDGIPTDVNDTLENMVGVGPERGYNSLGGTYGLNMALNTPPNNVNGSIGLSFVRLNGTPFLLNAKLMAMESQGEGKIVSSPRIVTLDNKKANIKQGISVPLYNYSEGRGTVTYKDVALELGVTPHVTPDNRISMLIEINKNDLGSLIDLNYSYIFKEARTELLVNDGDTVVIGGVIKDSDNDSISGVPVLSKIPFLGWFFKSNSVSKNKEELLIFITPTIIQLEQRNT